MNSGALNKNETRFLTINKRELISCYVNRKKKNIIGIHFQHTNFLGDSHEQIRRCSPLDIA